MCHLSRNLYIIYYYILLYIVINNHPKFYIKISFLYLIALNLIRAFDSQIESSKILSCVRPTRPED